MRKLTHFLDKVESYLPQLHRKNDAVSKVDVAWQLDHSLNVLISISRALQQSEPAQFERTIKPWWILLGTLYWFPRGKGKSPKVVLPDGEITQETLEEKLTIAREEVTHLANLPKDAFFTHPLFGNLKLKSALRFMGMHTHHHIKICRDILKS